MKIYKNTALLKTCSRVKSKRRSSKAFGGCENYSKLGKVHKMLADIFDQHVIITGTLFFQKNIQYSYFRFRNTSANSATFPIRFSVAGVRGRDQATKRSIRARIQYKQRKHEKIPQACSRTLFDKLRQRGRLLAQARVKKEPRKGACEKS